MHNTHSALLCLLLVLSSSIAFGQTDHLLPTLGELVRERDDSFRWEIRHRGQIAGCECLQVHLVSQVWQGNTWRHTMFVIMPPEVPPNQSHALMLIDGGSWQKEWGDRGPGKLRLPSKAMLMANVAWELKTPVAIIGQIPFQPMLGGLREDALIAATLAKFYQNDDPSWPLLPAMARAGARGMDAMSEIARQQWNLKLEGFTVTGASKRGWTTYLLGASDPRVKAIAPMVIDVLNMGPQMKHQLDCWGQYSSQLEDYTRLGLQKTIGTPKGDRLMSMVDPYVHREKLTMPKLVILGTNDPYWPVDASRWYFNKLPGPKGILNLPNNSHGLNDVSRLIGSITALHRSVTEGKPLPEWSADVTTVDRRVTVSAHSTAKPSRVYGWVARSDTRDFRHARWRARSIAAGDEGKYRLTIEVPESGYVASICEAQYDGRSMFPLSLTSQVHVAPDK